MSANKLEFHFKLGGGRESTLIVRPGDNISEIIESFSIRHNLNEETKQKAFEAVLRSIRDNFEDDNQNEESEQEGHVMSHRGNEVAETNILGESITSKKSKEIDSFSSSKRAHNLNEVIQSEHESEPFDFKMDQSAPSGRVKPNPEKIGSNKINSKFTVPSPPMINDSSNAEHQSYTIQAANVLNQSLQSSVNNSEQQKNYHENEGSQALSQSSGVGTLRRSNRLLQLGSVEDHQPREMKIKPVKEELESGTQSVQEKESVSKNENPSLKKNVI